jgi:hypothetical protein
MPLWWMARIGTVHYDDNGGNTLVDHAGILEKDVSDLFVQRRERVVRDFVAHMSSAFDEDTVVDAVIEAEEAFLLEVLHDLDGAGKSESINGEWRSMVSFRNIKDVMMVLYRPTAEGLAELKLIDR